MCSRCRIQELEIAYQHSFPNQGDYKQSRLSWSYPVKSECFSNEMSRALNTYRDEYMIQLIAPHMKEGQRVFEVAAGRTLSCKRKLYELSLALARTESLTVH